MSKLPPRPGGAKADALDYGGNWILGNNKGVYLRATNDSFVANDETEDEVTDAETPATPFRNTEHEGGESGKEEGDGSARDGDDEVEEKEEAGEEAKTNEVRVLASNAVGAERNDDSDSSGDDDDDYKRDEARMQREKAASDQMNDELAWRFFAGSIDRARTEEILRCVVCWRTEGMRCGWRLTNVAVSGAGARRKGRSCCAARTRRRSSCRTSVPRRSITCSSSTSVRSTTSGRPRCVMLAVDPSGRLRTQLLVLCRLVVPSDLPRLVPDALEVSAQRAPVRVPRAHLHAQRGVPRGEQAGAVAGDGRRRRGSRAHNCSNTACVAHAYAQWLERLGRRQEQQQRRTTVVVAAFAAEVPWGSRDAGEPGAGARAAADAHRGAQRQLLRAAHGAAVALGHRRRSFAWSSAAGGRSCGAAGDGV